jgi:hypothetical protein
MREHYRLKTPTLAIMTHDGQRIPITIPQGGTVVVVNGPLDGTWLVDVEWEGKTVMMFTTDVRERGERLDAVGR